MITGLLKICPDLPSLNSIVLIGQLETGPIGCPTSRSHSRDVQRLYRRLIGGDHVRAR